MFGPCVCGMATDTSEPQVQLGDVVLTNYGVGVVVEERDEFVSVRLWRIPGRSVGSSAKATLQKSTVRFRMPDSWD